jgi:hypothetical protein
MLWRRVLKGFMDCGFQNVHGGGKIAFEMKLDEDQVAWRLGDHLKTGHT